MQKSDADFFMFVDADVHFEPESVVRLIKSGHDISVACYPKKYVDWSQAAKAAEQGDERNMAMLSASLVVNFGASQCAIENGCVRRVGRRPTHHLVTRKVCSGAEAPHPTFLTGSSTS